MKTYDIRYIFRLSDDRQEVIDLHLNAKTLNLVNDLPDELPSWTRLDFYQCTNCLLSLKKYPYCPIAAQIVNLMRFCSDIFSYDNIHLEVITSERIIKKNTTAQKGISSLMGLIMATSGCPHTSFFKPMARFHLPFANTLETLYRTASMYLLAQFFLKKQGRPADMELNGLVRIYRNIEILNRSFAERLLSICEKDAAINAIINLDIFAQTFFYSIKDSLEDIQYLFEPYFSDQDNEIKYKKDKFSHSLSRDSKE